jgi:hypothetical protein
VATFNCCDTIAYGSWGIDKPRGLIYLNCPLSLEVSTIDMEVKEEAHAGDSLIFMISNPIEKEYSRNNTRKRDIKYQIALMDKIGSPITENNFMIFENNYVKIPKPQTPFSSFSVSIFPKDNFRGRNISTKVVYTNEYKLKDPKSSVFYVNIPDLTDGFIVYLRLVKD